MCMEKCQRMGRKGDETHEKKVVNKRKGDKKRDGFSRHAGLRDVMFGFKVK